MFYFVTKASRTSSTERNIPLPFLKADHSYEIFFG